MSEELKPLYFKKLHKDSQIPIKGSLKSAGYDLFSYENIEIPPMEKALVHTGISVQLPEYSYGRVAPRSGLTWKKFIDVGAGVIDEDYRGESKYIYIIISLCYFI
jgi:deoxyuridine 5'-triphosphate nucleotidohydrolase